ncbi:MAG: polysaccharide deacetylase family protein [Bacteroidales bacterium]|nr:polysaccharide deacetylase family protein [Bacteroidales bacterium]
MNILTFDIEDWYMSYDSSQIAVERWPAMESRIASNITDILQFLETHQLRATFFIMGWVAGHNPEVIRKIARAGHEIGYHSYHHDLPLKQGPEVFEEDLCKGLSLLRALTGQQVCLYRAPRFSFSENTAWCIPILLRHGINISSSAKSGRMLNSYRIPQEPVFLEYGNEILLELPLNRAKTLGLNWVYTGSGYFRLLPFSLLNRLYGQSSYNMAYFHPRDFDTDVPQTALLPFYRNIMCRMGNSSTVPKLSALLETYRFVSVGKAAETYLEKPQDIPRLHLG